MNRLRPAALDAPYTFAPSHVLYLPEDSLKDGLIEGAVLPILALDLQHYRAETVIHKTQRVPRLALLRRCKLPTCRLFFEGWDSRMWYCCDDHRYQFHNDLPERKAKTLEAVRKHRAKGKKEPQGG